MQLFICYHGVRLVLLRKKDNERHNNQICILYRIYNFIFSDFVAYRDNRYGSIYIKNLSDLLFEKGFTTKLTDILTQVTAITSGALANVCQVPSFTSTLTKSLLFTRKKKSKLLPLNCISTFGNYVLLKFVLEVHV